MTNPIREKRPITLTMSQSIVPASEFKTAVDSFIDLIESVSAQVLKEQKVSWGIGVREGSAVINAYAGGDNEFYVESVGSVITAGLSMLASATGERPAYFDDKALHAARKLSALQSEDDTITLSTPWQSVALTPRVAAAVTETFATKYTDYGTLEGTVQRLDITTGNALTVRLTDSLTSQTITLHLPDEETLDAFYAFIKHKRRVSVSGETKYSATGRPSSMRVEMFSAFPDSSELPSIDDIVGILRGHDA